MNNLFYLRKKLKLSYHSLETYAGIDRTTLNNIEHGTQRLNDKKMPSSKNIWKGREHTIERLKQQQQKCSNLSLL